MQRQLQHSGVFSSADGLVVAATRAHLLEA
jgi:hypothetical protein